MKSFIAYKFLGESPEVLRPMLTAVTEAFKQRGIESYCTFFDYDEVRDKGKTAGEIMAHAFSVIDSSEFLFVILASEEKSEGMILEVGYCIAKGIPVIIAVKEGVKNTYLPEMGKKTFIWRDNQDLSAKIAELGV